MAKKDRMGKRKPRKSGFRTPELGYYLIVTNTTGTERCYFKGLFKSLPEEIQKKIVIKVFEEDTNKMLDKCVEEVKYNAQYRIPWIIFDRDRVSNFDEIIREANSIGVCAGWSNPCIEIWMFAYFGMMPNIWESKDCVSDFKKIYEKKTGQEYYKTDEDIYQHLYEYGNEEKAFIIAEQKLNQCVREKKSTPSEMCPATMVYMLVREIRGKVNI